MGPMTIAEGEDLPAPQTRGQIFRCHLGTMIFAGCCLFVVAVSVHDAMLVVVNHQSIQDAEQNPLGTLLIEAQEGEVWLFVLAKLAGTALVWAILITLYQHRARLAFTAAASVAAFQMALLGYLTFA